MTETDKIAIKEPSSSRLIVTLGVTGFFSGLLLVMVYLSTLPMIEANKAAALEAAIYKVLPGCSSFETLVISSGKLMAQTDAVNTAGGEAPKTIYIGYNDGGKIIGFAIPSEEPGFQDVIIGIFGYEPDRKMIVGFEVLESKETPGLGDKIIKDRAFTLQFKALAVEPEIVSVKKGEKHNPNEVEAITGATISSKTVVKLLQKGVEEWQGAIEEYVKSNVGQR